mmetsp:Transcript_32952/g.59419  ORF Transcript_32952/g.59419 Transcript_32952/m.59419 type:complete len:166 (-) Transcript_32952:46-543(-)|eukprot:CAMPEP_0201892808 /NCGR_PEP_ID=MMETSP0902-20130614/37289_1 /ASSEMBLY_ACC=CAM_ASM_000551 /TAXON_ID=420261 /ORGANISM="Thalassiosira antarctica, Strain CCMP982" /LENGTH=165 /DNA_ID=CAMNT_0048424391 /DNA_START=282 /DNA_END=779 /DNA_ORIENTATION=+
MSTTPPPPSPNKASLPSNLHHRQNSCQVTRAVETMSSFHHTSMKKTLRLYFYSRAYFPKILGGIMIASGIAGYACMGWWHDRKMKEMERIYSDAYHNGDRVSSSIAKNVRSFPGNGKNGNNEDSDNGLVALTRNMTRRIVASSRHATLSNATDSSRLQRQVTKFW